MRKVRCIATPWVPHWIKVFHLSAWPVKGIVYISDGMFSTKVTPSRLAYSIPCMDNLNGFGVLWDIENFEEVEEVEEDVPADKKVVNDGVFAHA